MKLATIASRNALDSLAFPVTPSPSCMPVLRIQHRPPPMKAAPEKELGEGVAWGSLIFTQVQVAPPNLPPY